MGNTIEVDDSAKIRYDKNVKEILADIQVLARIVKHTVAEVDKLSISEIMSCIDRGAYESGRFQFCRAQYKRLTIKSQV